MNFGVEITPVKTSHSLDRICHMVRSGHINARPSQSSYQEPALLLHEVIKYKFVVDQSAQVSDLRLALVLLIEFGSEQETGESDQFDVSSHVSI